MQHQEFFTVWHSPKAASRVFAPASDIQRTLSSEYGIVSRVTEESTIPNHVAIQVPGAHVSRAAFVCEDRFGRFSGWRPPFQYTPPPAPREGFFESDLACVEAAV